MARAAADTAASRVAHGALDAAAFVEWLQTPPPTDSMQEAVAEVPSETPEAIGAEPSGAVKQPRSARGSKVSKPPARRGILVRRTAVAAAVRRGVRPSAGAVAATAEHPAGLIVHGWGAAGTALRDGDIIVSVGGRTPSSIDDVIGAVAGAYRHKVYAVSGRIWRAGETMDVSVELPIPRDAQPSGASTGEALSENGQRTPRSMGGP